MVGDIRYIAANAAMRNSRKGIEMADLASVKDVKDFFEMTVVEMKNEWTQGGMTDQDKMQIRQGIGDGTLNY